MCTTISVGRESQRNNEHREIEGKGNKMDKCNAEYRPSKPSKDTMSYDDCKNWPDALYNVNKN